MPRTIKVKDIQIITDPRHFELDAWQDRVLNYKGNIVLRTGRQVGKTTVVSLKARKLATEFPGTTTIVLAAAQRQASYLFEKIRGMFESDNREVLEKAMGKKTFSSLKLKREWEKKHSIFESDPTMTRINLKNGSIIYCLPTGKTGAFIRGFTADFIIADEAARIPREVFIAIEPMLDVRKKQRNTGWMILLSTPTDKNTYFYDACMSSDFLEIHITSEKNKRVHKKDLAKKKRRLPPADYAREYLAEFMESYSRYFQDAVVRRNVKIESWSLAQKDSSAYYYLGVDVARFGRDENAFVVAEIKKKHIRIVKAETSRRKELTETVGKILELHKDFNFKRIYIDGTGVGGGVVDLLRERIERSKIKETNASRIKGIVKYVINQSVNPCKLL